MKSNLPMSKELLDAAYEVDGMDEVSRQCMRCINAEYDHGVQDGKRLVVSAYTKRVTRKACVLVSLLCIALCLAFMYIVFEDHENNQFKVYTSVCAAGDKLGCQRAVSEYQNTTRNPLSPEDSKRISVLKTAYKDATHTILPVMEDPYSEPAVPDVPVQVEVPVQELSPESHY